MSRNLDASSLNFPETIGGPKMVMLFLNSNIHNKIHITVKTADIKSEDKGI